MSKKGIFIGATGQNVGKTTLCLGIMANLRKRIGRVGFMKPVGQKHVSAEGNMAVDKDVVLFKEHFRLNQDYKDMSPVLFPKGFTREYLDGQYEGMDFDGSIVKAFRNIEKDHDYVLVEGTGHIGVGSIIDLNNARVAKLLGLDVILISSGGIGRAFDDLALNRALLNAYGVKIRGVILNRVLQPKKEMVEDYISRALKRWDIPLIGCVPFNEFLSTASLKDFETLFKTELISGADYRYHHFEQTHFLAISAKIFKDSINNHQLVIVAASRDDVLWNIIDRQKKMLHDGIKFMIGLILTGDIPPSDALVQKFKKLNIPVLYTSKRHYEAMQMIGSYIVKILNEDTDKVNRAIDLAENNIRWDLLCS